MGISSLEVQKIIDQKRKYWYKTLSDTAMWTMLTSVYNTFDWLSFFGDWVLSDTLWSSLVLSLLFDIKLDEIIPINKLWDIELPSPEEFVRGVLIKLIPIDIRIRIKEIVPELEPVLENPEQLFEEEYQETVKESKIQKGYYGKSSYDNAYYDPPAVYEFLRSTVLAFLKKDYDLVTARTKVKQTAETLGVPDELARTLFNRFVTISLVKEQALTWDYGWFDRTYWGEEGSSGKVETITYELEVVKLPYDNLVEIQAGGYWDEANWDYFYWVEEYPNIVHPYNYEKFIKLDLQNIIHGNFRSRISTTPLAVANYQTRRERNKWVESERVETYAVPTAMRHRLESIVSNILRKYNVSNPIEARLYKSATLQLYSALSSPHKWGDEMFKSMTDEELKDWWIGRWSKEGLRTDILNEIFSRVRSIIKTYSSLRQKERIRFLRKRLLG